MCDMKNHVSPKNFSFVSFPGHQLTEKPDEPSEPSEPDSPIDEGDGQEFEQGEEWKVEKPAETLPDRGSPVFDAYDVAELYEAYARRSWYPFRILGGKDVSDVRWDTTPTLASDTDSRDSLGFGQYPRPFRTSSTSAGSSPFVISSLVKAFLDVYLSGTFTPHADPLVVFLDPDVALPDMDSDEDYDALSGDAYASDFTTTLTLDANADKDEPSANPVVNKTVDHVRNMSRGDLRPRIPFVSVASREVKDFDPVKVSLPNDPDTDKPVDPVVSSPCRVFRSGPELTGKIKDSAGSPREFRVEDRLSFACGVGNDDGTSTGVSAISPMAEWFLTRRTFYVPSGSGANPGGGFSVPDLIPPEDAYAKEGEVMPRAQFLDLVNEQRPSYPLAIPVSSLVYMLYPSSSPLNGYDSLSIDICPRTDLSSKFSDSSEVNDGLDVSQSPVLAAAVKAWSAPAPALVLPLFEREGYAGYGFPPPYGWKRTDESVNRDTDAPFLDVSANGTDPVRDATSFSVPVEARRLALESLGEGAEQLTRTVSRLRGFSGLSVEAVLDYGSEVTTTHESTDRNCTVGQEPSESADKKVTSVKREFVSDGPVVVSLTGSGGFHVGSSPFTPFELPCFGRKIRAKRESKSDSTYSATTVSTYTPEEGESTTTTSVYANTRNSTSTYLDEGECHVSLSKFRVVRDSEDPRGGYLTKCTFRVTTKEVDGDCEKEEGTELGGLERGTNVFDDVPEGIVKSVRLYALADVWLRVTGDAQKLGRSGSHGTTTKPSSDPSGYRVVNETLGVARNAGTACHWNRLVDLGTMDENGEFPGTLDPFALIGGLDTVGIRFSNEWAENIKGGSPWSGGVSHSESTHDSKSETRKRTKQGEGTETETTSTDSLNQKSWNADVNLTWGITDWFLVIDWDFEADVKLELGDEEKDGG